MADRTCVDLSNLLAPVSEPAHSSAWKFTWSTSVSARSSASFISSAPFSPAVRRAWASCPHWESVFHWSPTVACLRRAPTDPSAVSCVHEWSGRPPAQPCNVPQSSSTLHESRFAPPSCDAQRAEERMWSSYLYYEGLRLYPKYWNVFFLIIIMGFSQAG